MSLSDQLAKEIAEGKAEKLIKAIASELAKEPEARALIIEGVLKDVATKEDLEKAKLELKEEIRRVESELRQDVRRLDSRIDQLNQRFDTMLKWIIGMLVTMWITIVAGIIVALMKMG